jgi:hypothetical protein
MTDPAKINMIERSELVERFVDMTERVKNMVGDRVTVVHVTMLPRFTKECCRAHMAEEDVWLLDGLRRDVNKEIVDGLKDKQTDIKIMEWWKLLGAKEELTLSELSRMDCVDDDNVHLRKSVNRSAAEILCRRILEMAAESGRMAGSLKRRRRE